MNYPYGSDAKNTTHRHYDGDNTSSKYRLRATQRDNHSFHIKERRSRVLKQISCNKGSVVFSLCSQSSKSHWLHMRFHYFVHTYNIGSGLRFKLVTHLLTVVSACKTGCLFSHICTLLDYYPIINVVFKHLYDE